MPEPSYPREPHDSGVADDSDDTAPLPRVTVGGEMPPAVRGELPMPDAGERRTDPVRRPPPGAAPPPGNGQRPPTRMLPRPQGKPAGRGLSRVSRYALYTAALVGVAVLSGVLWWVANRPSDEGIDDTGVVAQPPPSATSDAGRYDFTTAHRTLRGTDCHAHSYGKVHAFFAKTPCSGLRRTLYTTKDDDGVVVYTGVRVIQMPDAHGAAALERIADSNGTGNVADVLREGIDAPGAPSTVAGGGYASSRDGAVVTIVESKPARGEHLPGSVLTEISRDALRLG